MLVTVAKRSLGTLGFDPHDTLPCEVCLVVAIIEAFLPRSARDRALGRHVGIQAHVLVGLDLLGVPVTRVSERVGPR